MNQVSFNPRVFCKQSMA